MRSATCNIGGISRRERRDSSYVLKYGRPVACRAQSFKDPDALTTASLRHSTRPPHCTIYCNSLRACWAGTSPLRSAVALSLSLSFATCTPAVTPTLTPTTEPESADGPHPAAAQRLEPPILDCRAPPLLCTAAHDPARASALCTYYCVCAVRPVQSGGEACAPTRSDPPSSPPALPTMPACPFCPPLTTASCPLRPWLMSPIVYF